MIVKFHAIGLGMNFFEANQVIRQDQGNLARFWQSGKITATWQDCANLAKLHVGINTYVRQSGNIQAIWQDSSNLARVRQFGKIPAIWKDSINLATKVFKIFFSILSNVSSTLAQHITTVLQYFPLECTSIEALPNLVMLFFGHFLVSSKSAQ
jgi:hypothetical protein